MAGASQGPSDGLPLHQEFQDGEDGADFSHPYQTYINLAQFANILKTTVDFYRRDENLLNDAVQKHKFNYSEKDAQSGNHLDQLMDFQVLKNGAQIAFYRWNFSRCQHPNSGFQMRKSSLTVPFDASPQNLEMNSPRDIVTIKTVTQSTGESVRTMFYHWSPNSLTYANNFHFSIFSVTCSKLELNNANYRSTEALKLASPRLCL